MLSTNPLTSPKAAIVGLKGTELLSEERAFFQEHNPLGFILFARNCQSNSQIKALVRDLRSCVGRNNAPVLIDQEGGRVARLRPPLFPSCPTAGWFAALAKYDIEVARKAAYFNADFIGNGLKELGISVNCAPVADIYFSDAHEIIGDRSFGDTPEQVAALARATCEGLVHAGVLPVIKHIPGHGRARVDSHEALPVVDAPIDVLEKTDFAVFKLLADMPWAMTAHIIYTAIDPELPVTLSPKMIQYIRKEIGFEGILLSDDLSMKALTGSYSERTKQLFHAGCDLALHCNGEMEEMAAVLANTPRLGGYVQETLAKQQML